jgi:hypothetical protein
MGLRELLQPSFSGWYFGELLLLELTSSKTS